jgi:hypothetical protein
MTVRQNIVFGCLQLNARDCKRMHDKIWPVSQNEMLSGVNVLVSVVSELVGKEQ